ncbi:ATP-binding protein [Streptomyces sp. NPDC059909]|uniref:ATP-binding protein n=1 Tax=Streptomyces sp. NPDC059909 TaxID=3346998 RepID=UPI003666B519
MSAAVPAQGQTRRLVLSGPRGAVGRCRDFSRAALADWGWLPDDGADEDPYGRLEPGTAYDADGPDDAVERYDAEPHGAYETDEAYEMDETAERRAVAEDVLMVVSELVTNACLHTDGPQELVLHVTPERVRIEVSDASPVPPRPRPHADPAIPGGHGLIVLGRLARAWGSVSRGTGKTVWAEVAAPRRSRPAPPS